MLAREVLYHLGHAPSHFASVIFQIVFKISSGVSFRL
jgi:hypothetical protein